VRLLLAALAGSAVLSAWLGWQLHNAKAELAAERQRTLTVALAHAENAHKTTATWAGKVSRAQRDREAELQAVARLADDLRAERDGLRGDIATFAAGSAGDSLGACRDRAATLGQLLDSALQASERGAGAAERHAADVRALLSAWPVAPAVSSP
jgi:hypothetical protein